GDLARNPLVHGALEAHREMLRADLAELLLEVQLASPSGQLLLEIPRVGDPFARSLEDRDGFLEPSGSIVQVRQPPCRREEAGIARERALEAGLRQGVAAEHEGGKSGAETQARVVPAL